MSKFCAIDMDGTLFNLYGKPNWLDDLENEREGVFNEYGTNHGLMPGIERHTLQEKILNLIDRGFTFSIISWLPMGASPEYLETCRKEKLHWLAMNLPMITNIQLIPYGLEKQKAIIKKATRMYLIDDNAEVCAAWKTAKQRTAIQVDDDYNILDALDDILIMES